MTLLVTGYIRLEQCVTSHTIFDPFSALIFLKGHHFYKIKIVNKEVIWLYVEMLVIIIVVIIVIIIVLLKITMLSLLFRGYFSIMTIKSLTLSCDFIS